MTNRQYELIQQLKKFDQICKDNKIWYALSGSSLLSSTNENKMLEGLNKIEVMMTIEAYSKLKNIVPKNVIDGAMDANYPDIYPKFIYNNKNFDITEIFLKILIIVPTTLKKVKKWRSLTNRNNFLIKKLHSRYVPKNFKEMIIKFFTWPISTFYKQTTFKSAYNKLFDKKNEGFYLIHEPKCRPYKHWIPHLTFYVDEIKFEDIRVNIPTEWKTILEVKYGQNYRNITTLNT